MFEQAKVSGVLALRGDRIDGAEPAGVFEHASDLAVYIRQQRPDMKSTAPATRKSTHSRQRWKRTSTISKRKSMPA